MILKSSKEAECPEELMWEKMLDIAGLDDGFPVIGTQPESTQLHSPHLNLTELNSAQPSSTHLHGRHKTQQIWQRTNNFFWLVLNITKLPPAIEFAIPKNPMFFVFRFCYIMAGK